MCGIFGIITRNASIPDGVLERGTKSLAHRGPDDSGTVVIRDSAHGSAEIGLGNRRLAILDLSPLAHQPMQDAETGNWIVYNGEIYNFKDVRAELERLGTTFISHSDTEVLLKAYARWGESCLLKFRGMFAFALWDARRHQLFLARDPMGIKPLYYAETASHFIFASEVRSLLGTDLLPHRIDPAGLANFLTFGSAYDPLTLIQGVKSLAPGHTLTWRSGTLTEASYWDLVGDAPRRQDAPSLPVKDENQAVALLTPLLEDAVRMQLVSDVPVGVFLSGGIDSSALVSILSRGGFTPSTFSIIFREADFSEAEHSRAIAAKFHTDHHEITVSQSDVLAAIPDAMAAMDLPTMDGINTYFVSRETRRAGVKVALSGLGGDEVFAGYSTFRTVPRMERFARAWNHLPRGLRAPLASGFAALTAESDQNRKLASLAGDNGLILHPYFLSRMLFTPRQRESLLRTQDSTALDRAAASQMGTSSQCRATRSCEPSFLSRIALLHAKHLVA